MKIILILVLVSTTVLSHPGVRIAEDSKGNIYYTDLKQVWKISTDGKKLVIVPEVHTHELYIDKNDNLFGEHLWYNGESKNTWSYYVWKLSAKGVLEKVINDREGFREDYSFVREASGSMFKANRDESCQKLMKGSGKDFKPHGQKCYHNIRFMTVSKNGEVLLVDFQHIFKIDQSGNARLVASAIADKSVTQSSISNQNSVMGIWDDDQGNIYTAVYSNRVVKKFGVNGKEAVVYKSSFPWSPSGGIVAKSGDLWILEGSVLNDARAVQVSIQGKTKAY